ncbi:MAG: response regulator [Acidimicrobiia bacterium]|nr:response regulator [Acidimicrobiia bacterium]
MSFSDDAELRELFRQEVDERVARLIEGSQALAEGDVPDDVAGTMFREGHTIKGTGRVMGFVAISRAGQALEGVWRQLQHGDIQASPDLAGALERLSRSIPDALDSDSEKGSPELNAAIAGLNDVLNGSSPEPAKVAAAAPAAPERVEAPSEPMAVASPEPLEVAIDTAESVTDVVDAEEVTTETTDQPAPVVRIETDSSAAPAEEVDEVLELGGLLGALDTWASEEMTRVNAAQMYRLINTVASLDLHSQALRSMIVDVADAVEASGADDRAVQRIASGISALEQSVRRAREYALHLAAAQLRDITDTFPQLVAYLAKKTGKDVRFELVGDECGVDRQIIERLGDPLRQLIVNAIEHGIETPAQRASAGKSSTATLSVRAAIKDHRMEIVVEDDGLGIDWEAVHTRARRRGLLPGDAIFDEGAARALLFAPGFSTADNESELVGDGNGLTMVAERIEDLHGSLELDTELGVGTKITLAVPTSRALQDALIVRSGGQQWGFPEAAIADVVELATADVRGEGRRQEIMWMDQLIPLYDLASVVGLRAVDEPLQAVVLRNPLGATALAVAEVIGQRQVAAKELGPLLGGSPHLTGAALLGGGDVVVLVEPSRLQERAKEVGDDASPALRVLVVDDSQGARQVLAGALASNGFEVDVAGGAEEALASLARDPVDALVVDFSMPGPDGIDLVNSVRRLHLDLPIVMLSGVATHDDQERARLSGVNVYFDKADFREGALAETLRDLIESRDKS